MPCLCLVSHLPAAPGSGFCLSSPSPAVPLGGARRVPGLLYVLQAPTSLCTSVFSSVPPVPLQHSAAEKPACWQAGLSPPPLPEPQPYSFVLLSLGS